MSAKHERQFQGRTIELVRADITTLHVDAIVNAANAALAGGGGVDGAIHRAGGPSIMAQCREIGGCPPGSAVITGAGTLRARHVIHAVAPIYNADPNHATTLMRAYVSALGLAAQHGLKTIAFPSLGTGAYGYPVDRAAAIAVSTVRAHLVRATSLERVTFALFSDADLAKYATALRMYPE